MIPPHTKMSIDLYIDKGYCSRGSFIYAVLTNDLMEAACRADQMNQANLTDICKYLYNLTPSACWGSVKKVEAWALLHKEHPDQAQKIAKADEEQRAAYVGTVRVPMGPGGFGPG